MERAWYVVKGLSAGIAAFLQSFFTVTVTVTVTTPCPKLQNTPAPEALDKRARIDSVYHANVLAVHLDALHDRSNDLSTGLPVSRFEPASYLLGEVFYTCEYQLNVLGVTLVLFRGGQLRLRAVDSLSECLEPWFELELLKKLTSVGIDEPCDTSLQAPEDGPNLFD